MSIECYCPNTECGRRVTFLDDSAGTVRDCPRCGATIPVPGPTRKSREVEEEAVPPKPISHRCPRCEVARLCAGEGDCGERDQRDRILNLVASVVIAVAVVVRWAVRAIR